MERPSPIRIASKENRLYRRLLAVRSGRPEEGDGDRLLVEGYRLCSDALASGIRADLLVLSEDVGTDPRSATLADALPDGAGTVLLSDPLFRRLCRTEEPQGFLLLLPGPGLRTLPPAADPQGRYLVLEDVRDPGNVGSMVRTADAAGLSAVVCTPGCADPFGDKALRASMGSAFHLPVVRAEFPETCAWLRAAGLIVVAADLDGEDALDGSVPGRGAVLVGNEAEGLSGRALAESDRRVRIPMPGRAESLNAAAAAAVLVYEMLRASRKAPDAGERPAVR